MAIDHEQLEAWVQRLEAYASRQPTGYRVRVGFLAALGYVYIFFVLVLALGLLGLLVWMGLAGHINILVGKVGLALVVLIGVIVRSLFVSFPPPKGVPLSCQEFPRLFDAVDEISAALQAPRFHHILLDGEFNASVAQRPRLGIFGWQKNFLKLGLPLMEALSPDQFRSVLAHEIGHLSRNHGRFSGWIYRVRQTWEQLLGHLQKQKGKSIHLFDWFFRWYEPRFAAYSFVLARANEYVADRCAAQVAGAKNSADALIRIHIQGRAVKKTFWPEVFKQVEAQDEPPLGVFTSLSEALRTGTVVQEPVQALREALAKPTGYANTHPALSDRLRALGCLPEGELLPEALPLPIPGEETAADYFLGDGAGRLRQTLDQAWRQDVAPAWKERYRYVQSAQGQLLTLEEKARTQPLTEQEDWQRARWTAEFKGNAAALPLLQQMLTAKPEDPRLHYAYGQLLLKEGDSTGIAHIEQAMQRDPSTALEGCRTIYAFLMERGRKEEALPYLRRFDQQAELKEKAKQQRATIHPKDRFLPHDLPATQVAALVEQLACYPQIEIAYLVRKDVSPLPEKPFCVIGIVTTTSSFKFHSEDADRKLLKQLATSVRCPENCPQKTVFAILTGKQRLWQAIRRVPGSEIYRRQKGSK